MNTVALAQLDALPRVRLAHLPTPIEALPNLSRALSGPELFIKRDDQTGLATGGNKARKLEFLLAQAIAARADCVITAGSTQSNHARQTAAGAARCALAAHLVLYAPGGKAPLQQSGNLLLDHVLGAEIHWTEERSPYTKTIAQVENELRRTGHTPYVIPYGGSNAYGLLGYVDAMREFMTQTSADPPFDAVIFATSSGGTQAGMLLGAHVAELPATTRLIGISVDRPAPDLTADVIELARAGAELLGLPAASLNSQELSVDDRFLGGGYAVVGEPEREAIRLLARHEGILADPVYTGRALAGLIALIRSGELTAGQRVLFWHTGGSAALFAFASEIIQPGAD